jgi:formylglycine-generating enzyme required for sulfatase activity
MPKAPLPAAYVTVSANDVKIPDPTGTKTYTVTDAGRTIQVPEVMAYIPAGDFTYGAGSAAKKVHLDGFSIGKFDVTNAEYKAFLDADGSRRAPRYWSNGTFPEGKANHPIVYVSLDDALAYCDWVSKKTGWKVTIPTAEQWEKAARGPKGTLFPWGDSSDIRYQDGVMTSKYNFNGVIAAQCLKNNPKQAVTYNNQRSKYFGTKTTVDRIAAFDSNGNAKYLAISPNGMVSGWVNHDTYTGFIYTDLFTTLNNAGGNTSAVGSYEDGKSGYGIYDMAGNVWDWCDSTLVSTNGAERGKTVNEIRGGSWYAMAGSCKSISIGEGRGARGAYNTVGFRIIVVPPSAK